MEISEKTKLFESTPIPRAVSVLAIPTVLSSLVMVIYNLADTYFVGMLNDAVQNSAVTLAAPVLLAFNAVNNLFGVGASSMMSRALGRKDEETVRASSSFGFWCALICGIIFSLGYVAFESPLLKLLGADYLTETATAEYLFWTTTCGATPAILNVVLAYLVRAEGSSLHASIGTMSGCLLNIILDPVFIMPWGLGMGAAGAGLATFISNCFACLYFFVLLRARRGKTFVSVDPRRLRMCRNITGGVFAVGVPAAIQNLLNVTGMTVLNNFTSVNGPDAVAAMGIVQKINMVPLYVALGISQGIMPLVSYNYASGNIRRMKQTVSFTMRVSLMFIVMITVCYYFGAEFLTSLFMDNDAVVDCGEKLLRGLCLALPFVCIDFIAVGVFQACGMGTRSLIFAILRKIVLEIPALFILNSLFPLYGLAYAQPVAEVVLAVAAVITLASIFRRISSPQQANEPPESSI